MAVIEKINSVIDRVDSATMHIIKPGAALPLTTSAPREAGTPEDIARSVIEQNPTSNPQSAAPAKLGAEGLLLPGVTPADHSPKHHAEEEMRTFGGEKISRFLNPNKTASDGVMSMITIAAFKKAYYEVRWSSLGFNSVAAWLSFWTTRTWTNNLHSAGNYVKGFIGWLNLDWMGRTILENARLRYIASGKAVADFQRSDEQGVGKEAPE